MENTSGCQPRWGQISGTHSIDPPLVGIVPRDEQCRNPVFFVHREDLFPRPESSEDAYVCAFALVATFRLVGGLYPGRKGVFHRCHSSDESTLEISSPECSPH